jgi:hypothetical protein
VSPEEKFEELAKEIFYRCVAPHGMPQMGLEPGLEDYFERVAKYALIGARVFEAVLKEKKP